MRKNKLLILIFSILIFLLMIILLSNLKAAKYHCISANDFSIYQQAIYDIAAGKSFNPQLTIKNEKIFNDHIDPAIFIAAVFIKLFGYSTGNLLLFEWLWLVGMFIFLFSKLQKKIKLFSFEFLYLMAIILFSRSLLQGVEFPIHPTTWSMLPAFMLFYYIRNNQVIPVVALSIFLCLFREIYPFMIIGLSIFYIFNRKYGIASILFGTGCLFLFLFFYLRPIVMGPVINYGGKYLSNLINGHVFYIWERISSLSLPIKIVIPALVLFGFVVYYDWFKQRKKLISHPILAWILFVFPMILLHVLANRFEHHHTILFFASLLSLFVFSDVINSLVKQKKIAWGLLMLMILTSSSRYTRMINLLFFDKSRHCVISKSKMSSSFRLYKIVSKLDKNLPMIATGGLIQAIMRPAHQLYQICDTTKIIHEWNYLVLEKWAHGDLNPIGEQDVRGIINRCRKIADQVLFDDEFYIVMQGHFTDECIGMHKKWPNGSPFIPRGAE